MKTIREHVDFAYPLSKCPKPLVVEMVDDYIWLVVWNIWIIFHHIGNVITPTDELIFFKMVKTTNQIVINHH